MFLVMLTKMIAFLDADAMFNETTRVVFSGLFAVLSRHVSYR